MKDYSAMSDFEINREVAKNLGASPYLSDSGDFEKSISFGDEAVIISSKFKLGSFDPCNNPRDAWPIIVENKITLIMDNQPRYRATTNCIGWFSDEEPPINFSDNNPLRAAMIVFLMMKDAEK